MLLGVVKVIVMLMLLPALIWTPETKVTVVELVEREPARGS